jgi:hypothetical protein
MKTRTEQWSTTGGRGRSFFVTASVLALLALALLPMSARAGKSSGEITYFDGPPELESVPPQKTGTTEVPTKEHHQAHAHPNHNGSPTPTTGEDGSEAPTEPEGEPGSEGHHHAGAVPSGNGSNHPPGGGEPGKNDSPRPASESGRKPVRNVTPGPGKLTPSKTDASGAGGGGSSPLLPVLIAMAVLAAASIGVVLYRQRREDNGPDVYAG